MPVSIVEDSGLDYFFPINSGHYGSRFKDRVRQMYGGRCFGCNRKDRELQVHHIIPISVDPRLARDIENCIPLCADECHEKYGHCGESGKYYNPLVVEDCIEYSDDLVIFSHRVRIPNDAHLANPVQCSGVDWISFPCNSHGHDEGR